MLVLSRKIGEKIVIGQDIVVTVVSIDGNRAKIAIKAPDQVRILRSELLQKQPEEARYATEVFAGCC